MTRTLLPFILILLSLLAACAPAPIPLNTPSVDPAAIHTSVAATLYASLPTITLTPKPSIPTAVSPTQTSSPTPTPEIIPVPTMDNVPLLTGYGWPGTRVLEKPVGVTRDGITLAVEQVIVFADRIELVYTVRGIPHAALFDPMTDDPALTCEGPVKYPNLVLPGGEVIYPENYLLDGKARGMFEDYAASYLIHIYTTVPPPQVSDLTLVLDCLELARLDRAPRHWEVPFHITSLGASME